MTFRRVFFSTACVLAAVSFRLEAKPLIGWAQEAHPDYAPETFVQHLQEQKKYGATFVWIGHNNPGIVDRNKVEPGMSYAVYEAMMDKQSPLHADAEAQAQAARNLLNACRKERLKAVLAVGYQIQMGARWNTQHPTELRRQHDGGLFYAGGNSASWLSPVYQRDIQDYYRWIDREWVLPYKDVIRMLNLADEPHGGDYSAPAEAAFHTESGLSFAEADKTVEGQIQKGRFENLYIVRYAQWSANVWKTMDPSVRVTMSFCGSHGRFTNFEPNIHAIFRDTPDNFDITFDAFLIDNQPGDPIDGKNVSALAIFLRQVGALSRRYHKRVWLWPEANNWILSQWSPVKGNISDALFGVKLLRDMSAAAGIDLGGLAVWNLDVKEQGLFRDTHPLTYDPQRMFENISGDFKTAADPVALGRDLLIWIPESEADYLIGRKSYDYADRVYSLDLYAPFLERGFIPRLNSDNAPSFEGVKTVFLVSKYAPRLMPEGLQNLEAFVQNGGSLVTNYPVLKPRGILGRCMLYARFYWNAIIASLLRRPQSLTLPWGSGRIIFVFGKLNERLRNIVREFPEALVTEVTDGAMLPVNARGRHGLLAFPHAASWSFYNTNPETLTLGLMNGASGVVVMPDGTRQPIAVGAFQVTLPHGAWMELAN